jgi:hypothetical protein
MVRRQQPVLVILWSTMAGCGSTFVAAELGRQTRAEIIGMEVSGSLGRKGEGTSFIPAGVQTNVTT